MCGIAGWYRRGGRPVGEASLRAQCDAIVHRGPDDQGVLADSDFGFGMRRLSIVDLGGGHQPIMGPDGRTAIVFNGEIYNYRALRAELANYPFRTEGDAEVILAAWHRWGEGAWARLEGMFAVAIWDADARRLVLARDPLGIKPLYVHEGGRGLAFASELGALRALPELDFDVDPRAVRDVLTFGHVRQPRSIYAQVRQLRPGHWLSIGGQGEATEGCYWRACYREPAERLSAEGWAAAFRARWLETVAAHMTADVELGAFLSGGIDSSAVVAAMSQLSERPVRTFTIGFADRRFDETNAAAAVAAHWGCRHSAMTLEPAHALEMLPRVAAAYDEPFADPSMVPTWVLSRFARGQVKAALSGDGGDELFLGYRRHRTEWAVGHLPAVVRRRLGTDFASDDGFQRFFARTQVSDAAVRADALSPDLAAIDADHPPATMRDEAIPDWRHVSDSDLLRFAYADLTVNLPSAMLTKVDRASMAHGLEVRVPMLDHRLADWAMAVPTGQKLRWGTPKALLRRAVAPWLPPGIADRPKQGFKVPLATWFRGDFGADAVSLWRDGRASRMGWMRLGAAERLLTEHRAGRADHSRLLFAAAMLALWAEREGA